MDDEVETPEEIAQHYSSAMDSVNLINAVIANPAAYVNDETVMQRNVDHLELVIDWTFWTDEDLSPFTDAITAGKAHVAA
jgi:hypothetical protein